MSDITAEMFISEELVSSRESNRKALDSLNLYEGITDKYGYTIEDLRKSTKYYLQDGEEYMKILKKAKNIIKKRLAIIEAEVNKNKPIRWDIPGLINSYKNDSLYKEPYLRAIRWLTMQDSKIKWQFGDSAITDTPENAIWWKNNIAPSEPIKNGRYVLLRRFSDNNEISNKRYDRNRSEFLPNHKIQRHPHEGRNVNEPLLNRPKKKSSEHISQGEEDFSMKMFDKKKKE
jgi:hypothetical protein